MPGENAIAEPRSEPLDLRFDRARHVFRRSMGDVAISPSGVLPGRSAGVIEQALLRDQNERSIGRTPLPDRRLMRGDLVDGAAHMDGR